MNKIKSKTIYYLEFDSKELIRKSIEDIKNMPKIIGYLKLFTYLCRYKYMVI